MATYAKDLNEGLVVSARGPVAVIEQGVDIAQEGITEDEIGSFLGVVARRDAGNADGLALVVGGKAREVKRVHGELRAAEHYD